MTGSADFKPLREKSVGARLRARLQRAAPELRVTKHDVFQR